MKSARVAVPLAALLLFAGCGAPSASTAATVGDAKVTEQQVDDAAEGCAAVTKRPAAALRTDVAQFLVLGAVTQQLSRATGTVVTPAMHAAVVKQNQPGPLMDDPKCAAAVNGILDFNALAAKLGVKETQKQMRALGVTVNPRYGTWDSDKGDFTRAGGSLSRESLGVGQVIGG